MSDSVLGQMFNHENRLTKLEERFDANMMKIGGKLEEQDALEQRFTALESRIAELEKLDAED